MFFDEQEAARPATESPRQVARLALAGCGSAVGEAAFSVLRRAEGIAAFADDQQQLAVVVKGILGVFVGSGGGERKEDMLLLAAPLRGIEATAVVIKAGQDAGHGLDQTVEQPALRRPGFVGAKALAAAQKRSK